MFCDAWRVRRQTYTVTFPAYASTKFILLGNRLTVQDINPIAYVYEYACYNFAP